MTNRMLSYVLQKVFKLIIFTNIVIILLHSNNIKALLVAFMWISCGGYLMFPLNTDVLNHR